MTFQISRRVRATRSLTLPIVAIALMLERRPAPAQTIDNLSISKNAVNTADEVSTGNPRFERRSAVEVLSSASTSFSTRYGFMVATDYDGFQLLGASRTESLVPSYTVSFQVTAPGSYKLTVSTALRGDMNRVADDDGGNAGASVGATSGSQTGGTLSSGSLGLGDPTDLASGGGAGNETFSLTSTAVITGVSNGAPVTHTLAFSGFNSSCASAVSLFSTNAPECAVRGGLSADGASPISAGEYPGSPARVAGDDGHFVTVTVESLCGDGTIEAPSEQCDLGAANGAPDSCCAADCQFRAAGETCRAAASVCDVAETCGGGDAACPADAVEPSSTICRAAIGPCDAEEFCDGSTPACPIDQLRDASAICRAAAGTCDVPEHCSGGSATCGPDAREPSTTVCRPPANPFDVPEFCDGGVDCPVDQASLDVLLPGKRLRLADATLPSGRRSLLGITASGVNLAGIDPTVTGATLAMYSRFTGQLRTIDLPASHWTNVNGPRTTFRYLDPADRSIRAKVAANGVWRISLHGASAYALGAPQTELAARLTVGSVRYCAVFGGTIRRDDADRFIAVAAPAPASCPPAPGEPGSAPVP